MVFLIAENLLFYYAAFQPLDQLLFPSLTLFFVCPLKLAVVK